MILQINHIIIYCKILQKPEDLMQQQKQQRWHKEYNIL